MKTKLVVATLVSAFASLVAVPAAAQEYTRRSYILPDGSWEITGEPGRPKMAGLGIHEGQDVFDPFYLPVHFYFGVSKDLTLGVTQDRGICFNCEDDIYNNAGLGMGLLFGLVQKGDFELDLHLTAPLIQTFDPFMLAVRGGVIGRLNLGRVVAFVFDPSLKIGITNREEGNEEWLTLPVWFYFQASESVVPFVGSGLSGPLEGFGDNFRIPLEGGVIFSISRNVDIGGALIFPNLMGEGGSLDGRELAFIGRFRFD